MSSLVLVVVVCVSSPAYRCACVWLRCCLVLVSLSLSLSLLFAQFVGTHTCMHSWMQLNYFRLNHGSILHST